MTPQQALAQRRAALDKANVIRIGNAKFKADCAEGTTTEACAIVADVLRNTDAGTVEGMKVRHLLECIPRVGHVRVTRILAAAGIINGDRPLRAITTRQRLVIAEEVTYLGERWRHDKRIGDDGVDDASTKTLPLLGTAA
jgi:hypothetical protein